MTRILFLLLCVLPLVGAQPASPPFSFRGYYMTFMRMPLWGLPEWKQTLDCIHADGGNTVILWMGGGFRSKRFPITWKYNEEHKNIQTDFGRELIDYAHGRGIRVVLGFTPFGYDGVNQFTIEHPDLKAKKADGTSVDAFGIHCWGWSLCPSQERAQKFMREYASEMLFEFYPNADGLMIESSDYNVCRCPDCGPKYYEKEFGFVRWISDEAWKRNEKAIVLVYPHYFSGKKVNQGSAIENEAAKFSLDPRWTLFFTPHSAHLDPELVKRAGSAIFWNEGLTLGTPETIRDGARKAREFNLSGYVPSLEPFSYKMPREEFGSGGTGKRVKQLGFDWISDDAMPLLEIPARLQRLAHREFSKNPDLSDEDFRRIVSKELSGGGKVDDLFFLQSCINFQRGWSWSSPLVDPDLYDRKSGRGKWPEERRAEYRRRLERLRQIAVSSEGPVQRIASFIVQRWKDKAP